MWKWTDKPRTKEAVVIHEQPADAWKQHIPKAADDGEITEDLDLSFGVYVPPKRTRDLVKNEMVAAIQQSAKEFGGVDRHRVVRISPDAHSYYNSANIFCGVQGSGKTFTALLECLLIARNTNNSHMLIFVKKKDYDPSYESIKPLLKDAGVLCVEVEYAQAEALVAEIFGWKHLYNAIVRMLATNSPKIELPQEFQGITEEQIEKIIPTMLNMLHVADNFEIPWLNTLILFDDVGNSELFKKPDSYFNQRLKLCRDDNAVYFLTIHGIAQMSPSIRQNSAVIYIFRGLSRERLNQIHRQCNLSMGWTEFYIAYQGITRQQGARVMIVDNLEGSYVIE